MKLSDYVCTDSIVPQLQAEDRDGAIKELVQALADSGNIGKADPAEVSKAVIEREAEASTGIGKGVAVPHVKIPGIEKVTAAVGCSSIGIEFASLDKQPVYTVFLLLSPENDPDMHLQAMENLFKNLQNDDFRRFLRQADSAKIIEETIKDADDIIT